MTHLNVGQGRCRGTARLLIRPVRAVIELGAAEDVLSAALRAVHHANRHGKPDDFIAVAFPTMRMGREVMLPGHDLELIGSDLSLAGLMALEGVEKLLHRGMIEAPEIGEIYFEPGMTGAAYVRDQKSAKHTPGWIRRTRARAERRGKPLGKTVPAKAHDPKMLMLRHGDTTLHVREIVAEYTDAPLMVTTYGLSSTSGPAVLPVFPDSAREAEDAA